MPKRTFANAIAVNKYKSDGTFIRTYSSLKSAAKSVNRLYGTDLHNAILCNNGIYRNYKWTFVKEHTFNQCEPVVSEPPKNKKSIKYTPNTVIGIATTLNAATMYHTTLKNINCTNIKEYLNIVDKNNDIKYIAIPELLKYFITHPALIIHHGNLKAVVIDKMIEFENDVSTQNNIGSYIMTETYRNELLELIKTLKSLIEFYSNIKINFRK